MPFALRAGVSYAFVGKRAVFLDLVADRYFCASAAVERALHAAVASDNLDVGDQDALAPLIKAGLICEDAGSGALAPTRIDIRASLSDTPLRGRGWRELPAVVSDIGATRRALRRLPLAIALRRLVVRPEADRPATSGAIVGRIEGVASAYRRINLLLSNRDQCLPRSLAMARTLARAGIGCELVFGVTLSPFSAHCWVQRDGVVLNDALDHVRSYVPVMAV